MKRTISRYTTCLTPLHQPPNRFRMQFRFSTVIHSHLLQVSATPGASLFIPDGMARHLLCEIQPFLHRIKPLPGTGLVLVATRCAAHAHGADG